MNTIVFRSWTTNAPTHKILFRVSLLTSAQVVSTYVVEAINGRATVDYCKHLCSFTTCCNLLGFNVFVSV